MAEFLTTKRALAEIEALIDGADKSLTLLSPFQEIAPNYLHRLRLAADRGVQITFVYGKTEMKANQLSELMRLRGSRVLFQKDLHAKCYFNEHAMVITSLNLLRSSEQNWEMGIKLKATEPAYADAVAEAERIIQRASLKATGITSSKAVPDVAPKSPLTRSAGVCIRCSASIQCNPSRPFCGECFEQWDFYGNWEYLERYCHTCGRPEETSRARPLCQPCFAC